MKQKLNERAWTGQVISWIQEAIREGRTIFQDATNDAGIKLETGKTKFPDILIFTDKVSGIIFNGWELKFPDTPADDPVMLLNALEKAKRIKSNSFVTWNGVEAIIWKINDESYTIKSISKIKHYPGNKSIRVREDLSDPVKYHRHESALKKQLNEILHDLEQLYHVAELKPAINVSGNFINAVKSAAGIIIPQFHQEIVRLKGVDVQFRNEFNQWKIYESATLKILASSSRRPENVIEEEVLAKFAFYNLTGKIIFYLTLSENLPGLLQKLEIADIKNVKQVLNNYFSSASKIDYQAVYKPYFTDKLNFSKTVNQTLFYLFREITAFDFKVLPTAVIGTILENLVPKEEKQRLGQYFTPSTLASLVAFPAIQTANDFIFDPTSGTGTFLNSFYQILSYHGNTSHVQLLNQIWGNDISHFPAILSVINLYKHKIKNQPDNFPRVIRDDYFNLEPRMEIIFPDSNNYNNQIKQRIPVFDAIVSNFPFIQQEDIPNEVLTIFFRKQFETKQQAFLNDHHFKINERSDYFTYCIYNSIRFLKENGFLSAITSNAWLGKEYGFQFKKFLLDNFYIKYVVRSNAEHWFTDSKVSTVFTVLQYGHSDQPTRFITLNVKLEDYFDQENISRQLKQIEAFYSDIDACTASWNRNWTNDQTFDNLFHKTDGSVNVSLVPAKRLKYSINEHENWSTYFISADLFGKFDKHLVPLYPAVIDSFRGERTGWNDMFVIPSGKINTTGIEKKFLIPYVKSPAELNQLEFNAAKANYLFVCDLPMQELKHKYPGAYHWIQKFSNVKNRNDTKTIQEACRTHKPFWYSLRPKQAHIVTAINPFERFFFSFSEKCFTIDQRLAGITVKSKTDIELIAALFNSIITFLTVEMRGTSRNLGALDLNANYFKSLRVLNPGKLTSQAKKKILNAFEPLKHRVIGTIFEEVNKSDRIHFDEVVLKAFGIDVSILDMLYKILSEAIYNRVTLKER